MNKYLAKAHKLNKAGFWVAGFGHFNITTEELAKIIELIEEDRFEEIEKLYKALAKERL